MVLFLIFIYLIVIFFYFGLYVIENLLVIVICNWNELDDCKNCLFEIKRENV